MSGPVPRRSEDLARPRERKGGNVAPVTKGQLRSVRIPAADKDWHPIAKRWYNSLKTSGQRDFYQNSDWAFAYSVADDLSYYKKPLTNRDGEDYYKRSGQMLQSIYAAMTTLLVTEGDRRRVRIELSAPEEEGESAAVLAIADYRAELEVSD
jgi:hypothetical protein